MVRESLKAGKILAERYGITAAVWSATSYKTLYRDVCSVERHNRIHPGAPPQETYLHRCLGPTQGPIVAASDYVRALPNCVSREFGARWQTLGTDGFGRSDGRLALRRFFGVDAAAIAYAALQGLAREGHVETQRLVTAAEELGIDRDERDPEDR